MKGRNKNGLIESILVMIILVFFALAVFMLISSGGKTYDKTIQNKDSLDNARVTISYINVKVKQNDTEGRVYISNEFLSGKDVLVIEHTGNGQGMATYIFWDNGKVYECFINVESEPKKELSFEVSEVASLEMKQSTDSDMIIAIAGYEQHEEQKELEIIINLRSRQEG